MQASKTRNLVTRVFLTALAALPAAAAAATGAVFVGTNHNNTHPSAPPGEPANQIVMYSRAEDGSLSLLRTFDTDGVGSGPSIRFAGDGLGSAHSVQLSRDQKWLFVTNADSNDVSVFRVQLHVSDKELELIDRVSSRGVFPNSIAQHGDLVYVLNAAGEGNITGFRLSSEGKLTPLRGSTRVIRANQDLDRPDTLFNPTQVSFTPDGKRLVVTIKDGPLGAPNVVPPVGPTGPGRVLVFGLDRFGLPTRFTQTNLKNRGPFGFSFAPNGRLLTSLFVGGPGFTGSAGSFAIRRDGSLRPITPNVPNTQLDTCWLENNGTYAYGANYGSGTISSYRIRGNGGLRLLEAVAGITDDLPGDSTGKRQGSTPLDLAIGGEGQFLYNVLPGSGAVAGWRINDDGSLTKIGEFVGLPDSVNGDIALCEVDGGPSVPCEYGPGGSPAGIAAF